MSKMPSHQIVVTGRGVVSAIGGSTAEFVASLSKGLGGITAHDDIFPGQVVYAGIAKRCNDVDGLDIVAPAGTDHTARMAASAVEEALVEAGLWHQGKLGVPGERVALLLGSSHGGRSQLDRFAETGMRADDPHAAQGVMERGAHHHQSAVVATLFGIHGPVITASTACSSSGTAIAHGVDLLRAGRVDVVIAGGADAFSRLTYAGFAALGALADGPCGPFGGNIGITLGEGAAFIVLERESDARARGATMLAGLFACASSWDAYHLTAPEPSGKGMHRAIADALALSGLRAAEIDYINAHATGTRANDISETLAIKRGFEGALVPLVSATKSFTGHTLGASSAMGYIAGLTAMQTGQVPPTLNFGAARAGCDLDYVSNTPRSHEVNAFLAQSAAFGGANCVIAGGRVRTSRPAAQVDIDDIVISGIGVISPIACNASMFFQALLDGKSAAVGIGNGELAQGVPLSAQVTGFDARRELPFSGAARMDRVTQYTVAALNQAFNDAGLSNSKRHGNRIGLMVGLCRGAAASFEAYLEGVRGGDWAKASPIAFPNLVMSSVGGKAAIALGLKGPASTLVGGADVALALLSNAAEYLRYRSDIDALAVVASDELTPLYQHLDRTRRKTPPVLPAAEGAVAFVLERRAHADRRGAPVRAEVAGWAQTFDGVAGPGMDADGRWLERAIEQAVERAALTAQEIDLVITLACGDTGSDRRESLVLQYLFGDARPPITALAGHTGIAEATGGFFAVAGAVMALEMGCVPAPASALSSKMYSTWSGGMAQGQYQHALVAGSSEMGNNCAIVLRRPVRVKR